MFNIKKLSLNISFISSLFLCHSYCFSIGSNKDFFNSKLAKSLSTRFEYPRDDSRDHYDYWTKRSTGDPELDTWEGVMDVIREENDMAEGRGKKDLWREEKIAEILARGVQTKADHYKVIGLLHTEVDEVLEGDFPNKSYSKLITYRNFINIDDFVDNVGASRPKYGEFRIHEDLKTKRTSNCWGQIYTFEEDLNDKYIGVCYRPQQGEAGNMLYSYKDGLNIFQEEIGTYDFVNRCDGPVEAIKLSDPTLVLDFNKIFKPFTVEISMADANDRIVSYPKLHCVPDKLVYEIKLLSENSGVDFTQVKDISFTFKPVKGSKAEEQYFYLSNIIIEGDEVGSEFVSEPISLITMALGITKLIKKQKNKADLYKNKFDRIPLIILVK